MLWPRTVCPCPRPVYCALCTFLCMLCLSMRPLIGGACPAPLCLLACVGIWWCRCVYPSVCAHLGCPSGGQCLTHPPCWIQRTHCTHIGPLRCGCLPVSPFTCFLYLCGIVQLALRRLGFRAQVPSFFSCRLWLSLHSLLCGIRVSFTCVCYPLLLFFCERDP